MRARERDRENNEEKPKVSLANTNDGIQKVQQIMVKQ